MPPEKEIFLVFSHYNAMLGYRDDESRRSFCCAFSSLPLLHDYMYSQFINGSAQFKRYRVFRSTAGEYYGGLKNRLGGFDLVLDPPESVDLSEMMTPGVN